MENRGLISKHLALHRHSCRVLLLLHVVEHLLLLLLLEGLRILIDLLLRLRTIVLLDLTVCDVLDLLGHIHFWWCRAELFWISQDFPIDLIIAFVFVLDNLLQLLILFMGARYEVVLVLLGLPAALSHHPS